MKSLSDIRDRADIDLLVSQFYQTALYDEILFEPFTHLRARGLADHLPKIGDFWEKTLLRTGAYSGNPLIAHRQLHEEFPLGAHHFVQWLNIWEKTVDDLFAGPNALQAKRQAVRIAWSLYKRLTGEESEVINNILARYPPTIPSPS